MPAARDPTEMASEAWMHHLYLFIFITGFGAFEPGYEYGELAFAPLHADRARVTLRK